MTMITATTSAARANDVALKPPGRLVLLDARFAHGGAWAGVEQLIEMAWHDLRARGRVDLLARNEYALHMVLRRHRDAIPIRYASLTDLAAGVERTRNFPLDRAYRIGHALVDLILAWRVDTGEAARWTIVAQRFDEAQNLATRFFHELARRGAAIGIDVLAQTAGGTAWLGAPDRAVPAELARQATVDLPDHDLATAAQALRDHPDLLSQMMLVDRHGPAILAMHDANRDDLLAARTALRMICLFNHFGYYHESAGFVDRVLPYFDAIVGDDEDSRWNYLGNIYQGLVMTGRADEARGIVEARAAAQLSRPELRAKMHYLLAMAHLRYADAPDLAATEQHLDAALADLARARGTIPESDDAFLTVFIENGLAFLRVRQGRRDEALALCQHGYRRLTETLGEDKHRLHRSVLQYNSAQVCTMLGQLDLALEFYARAIEMDPYYSEYYNEVGNVLQRQERYDEALAAYASADRYSAPYPELFHNRGVCEARLDAWDAAAASLTRSLDLDPDQPDVLVLRAEAAETLGREDAALADLDAALAIDRDLVAARVNRAVIRYRRADYAAALADMDVVVALDDDPDHRDNRGAIHRAMGNAALADRERAAAAALRAA
ncbi:tetratricopeptide repeat protein [Sphingomonas oligophenolica]|nr:tetratricopeptide repeat protein [Sphingomonas oligophenolica]